MSPKNQDNSKGQAMMKKYGIASKDNIVTASKKIEKSPLTKSKKKGK